MGISVNGPSGIDTQYIIDSLVEIENTKVTRVQNQKKAYQLKIDAYAKLKTLLTDLGTRAENLSKPSSFDLFYTKSTNEKIATVTGGTGSVDATYDVRVFQLAGNEKMITADNLITDQNAPLSDLITVGTIEVDGVEIIIDEDDTLQDMRQKINSATDEDGQGIGVSASVLKISENNYRLVLTSRESGSAGVSYRDISGSTLQDLGIITDPEGDKGIVRQTLTSSGDMRTTWQGLSEGDSVRLTGTDRAGNEVTATVVKRAGDDENDFLSEVSSAFHGMVESVFDESGHLVVTDKIGGSSQLSLEELTFTAEAPPATQTMDVTTFGDEGEGVLSVGRDAFFSVENVYMSSNSNSASGFVSGATFEFHSVSVDETVTLTLERDNEAIRKKFQEIIDSYNALVRFSKTNTRVASPDDENSKSGDLAGDMTLRTVVSQFNKIFHQQFEGTNEVYTSFNTLGLKTDIQTGELSIDGEMFDKGITGHFDEVVNLFVTRGVSNNSNISLGTYSGKTQSGSYLLEEVDSEHFRARLSTGDTWYTSDNRLGEIVSFSEGPLSGLSITAPAGSIGEGNSASFTLSKGLSTIIDEAVESLTHAQDGLVALRTESWQRSMARTDDKILQLEERIENYRLRLVKQFSNMEQVLSQMQAQSTNMINALSSLSYWKS